LKKIRLGFLLLVLGGASWLSCAYYNVFWTAKSEYNTALEDSQIDFWDPYEQAPLKGATLNLVDSCIERCGKLLFLYPKSRWVDDALLLMGDCFVLKGEYTNALRKYDEILQLYGTGDFAPMAKYMKAYTLVLDGSVQQALPLLTGIVEGDEPREIRERGVYLLGRIYAERGDCDRAGQYFETYIKDYSKGARIDQVRLRLAGCLLRLDNPDGAITVLEPLAKTRTPEGFAGGLRLGEAYRAAGRNDDAVSVFKRVAEQAPADSVRARATMETGKTMVAEGQAEEGIEILGQASEIATTTLGALHDEIIYTQGLVYEKNLEDFEQAVTSYDQIARSKSAYAKMAARRSEALKAVARFKSALADTVVLSPEEESLNHFMLGETYLEALGLPGTALDEFEIVADSLPETKFGPRAILRVATLMETEGDSLEAAAYYRKAIDLFPETVYANVARSHLGLPLIDVETVVWEEGQVVGPAPPEAPGNGLSQAETELPGPPGPDQALPDTSRTAPVHVTGESGRTVRPHSTVSPGPAPGLVPEAGSPDTSGRDASVDSIPSGAPEDTTGRQER
jgi:TolA-binding protein